MKTLSHTLSPTPLKLVNETLEKILISDSISTEQLFSAIDERHQVIDSHLQILDIHEKKLFVNAEMPVNDYLVTFINAMFKESTNNLFTLTRGLRAVEKYKQI